MYNNNLEVTMLVTSCVIYVKKEEKKKGGRKEGRKVEGKKKESLSFCLFL